MRDGTDVPGEPSSVRTGARYAARRGGAAWRTKAPGASSPWTGRSRWCTPSPTAVLSARWLGWQAPLHATSTGKAFLAGLPWSEVASLLPAELTRYTDATIVDRDRLRAELGRVRERGYGLSVGEMEPNLYGVS